MTAPSRHHGKKASEWERMCSGKVRYPDEATCRARMAQLFDKGIVLKKRLWAYRCPGCRGYHMTSASQFGKHNSLRVPVTQEDIYSEKPQ